MRSCGGQGLAGGEGGQHPGKLAASTPTEHFPAREPVAQEPPGYASKGTRACDHGIPLHRYDPSADGLSSTTHNSPHQEQPKHPASVRHTANWDMFIQGL